MIIRLELIEVVAVKPTKGDIRKWDHHWQKDLGLVLVSHRNRWIGATFDSWIRASYDEVQVWQVVNPPIEWEVARRRKEHETA